MPKVLTNAQVETFERDGCLHPVQAMSAERAQHYRRKFEALEARVRGADTHGNFDDEPRPDAEWSPTALANWSAVTDKRARLIFADSKIGPSEAYGGTRRAT